jgi:HTH-type transcriptional regulator, cell division transcriptional repressor
MSLGKIDAMKEQKTSRLGSKKRNNICGEQIRRIRSEKGRTLIELCAELDVGFGLKMDRSVLGKIENGSRRITDIELLAIAAALQVELEALLPADKRKLLDDALKQKAEENAQEIKIG